MATLNTRIVMRNDTLANWEAVKDRVVLLKGEFGVAFDTNGVAKVKIGDGISTWGELDWHAGGTAVFENITEADIQALIADVEALESGMTALSERVGMPADEASGAAATGLYGEIVALVETMDIRMDEKIDEFANKLTDNGKIDTLMELIKYVEEHGEETAELTGKVTALEGKVTELETDVTDLKDTVIKEIAVNGVLVDVIDNRVDLTIDVAGTGVVSGDEIAVNEDGTLSIEKVDASKLVTEGETMLVLNGGSATV